tara:strand:+ start:120 stop:1340 length:1221 start_codon:yes stop_codon:yes gene_type:complete
MTLSLFILLCVLLAIAIRQYSPWHLPIWMILSVGAIAELVFQQINIIAAWHAINWDVIGFLFGVFVISQALESSGYLILLTDRLLVRSREAYLTLAMMMLVMGVASAFLMNDTLAIIGTPIVLQLTREKQKLQRVFLMALAFSVTIGSVMSPIGNPQNLLIAIASQLSFVTFIRYLFLPTMLCLTLAYVVLVVVYRKTLAQPIMPLPQLKLQDIALARWAKRSMWLFLLLIAVKIAGEIEQVKWHLAFSGIAMVSALPVLLGSRQRLSVIKKIDWGTLIFFASLFVVVQAVWDSGYLQQLTQHQNITSVPSIFMISTLLSQLISNVPLVALYLPILHHAGANTQHYLALAVGSTLAGNLLLFGAASNIIITQNAEKRGEQGLPFWQFSIIGIPLTLVSLLIYSLFV